MKGARYHLDAGTLVVEDLPKPNVKPGTVLLKVRYCGICGSDLTRYRQLSNPSEGMRKLLGKISPVPGHEICGIVERDGSPVVVHPQLGCGKCPPCSSGYWGGCLRPDETALIGVQFDGGLAEYVAVPFDHLIPLSKQGDDDLKKAVLAEPLAVALHMMHSAEPAKGESFFVIGDGPIGLLLFQLLIHLGYEKTTLVGRHEKKMTIARRANGGRVSAEEEITEEFHATVRCVFHTAGSQAAFDLGLRLLEPSGRMVTIGYLYGGKGLEPAAFNALIRNEKKLYGCYSYSFDEMREALNFIESGAIDVTPLIGQVVPLENCVKDGFDPLVASDPTPGKVLIRIP